MGSPTLSRSRRWVLCIGGSVVVSACGARTELSTTNDETASAGGAAAGGSGSGGQVPFDPVCRPGDPIATLASDVTWPYGLVADSEYLYFVTYDNIAGGVWRVPKRGGTLESLAEGLDYPNKIALEDGTLFFTESGAGRIATIPTFGGTVSTLFGGQYGVTDLGFDGGNLYWANYLGNQIVVSRATSPDPVVLASPTAPFRIAAGNNRVYFTSLATDVRWVTQDGSSSGSIPAEQPRDVAIAADGTVYWTDAKRGLWRSDPDGNNAETFGVPPQDPAFQGFYESVVLDQAHAYVANASGAVLRFSLLGDPPSVVARDQASPTEIITDETCVYWANIGTFGENASVMRAPK